MTRQTAVGTGSERLAKARANQEHGETLQRGRAVRVVDGHAIDSGDREMLIAMLGLDAGGTADAPGSRVERII
jgi:hypothetical protein